MSWKRSTTLAAEGGQPPQNDDKRRRNHHGQFSGGILVKWPEEGTGNGTMTVAGGHHTFLNLRR